MRCKYRFLAVFILLMPAFPSLAQENAQEPEAETSSNEPQFLWYKGFFIEASGTYCFASKLMQNFGEIGFGFRGALGYEYKHFRIAFESGYNKISGANPLISEISLSPVVLKFGYELPLFSIFGIQADVNAGILNSVISRYMNEYDVLNNNILTDKYTAPLAGARLYAVIYPLEYLKIYIGGGSDFVFETSGIIPVPLVEAGVSFKPFNISKSISVKQSEPKPVTKDIVFESVNENIIIEETSQGRVVRLRNAVYFEADTSVMLEMYRPILDEAGARLRSNPGLVITLRGFTAPFGTEQGRAEISRARAEYCADYLSRHYGIPRSRMKVESYGALRAPEYRDASWESYRCVELLIE